MALKAIFQVNEKGAYSDVATARVLRGSPLGHLDRGLVTELVGGSVRRRNTLDWVLDKYLARGIQTTPPWTRNALRLGAYQILYLDRIPASAAVDTAVELVKRHSPHTAGLVNAVLRRLSREGMPDLPGLERNPVLHLSIKHSHPAWLVERWLNRYGLEWTEALCTANNQSPPLALRVNTLKTTADQVEKSLLQVEGSEVSPSVYLPEAFLVKGLSFLENLPGIEEGGFLFQDEGSMLVSRALAPPPGSLTVDSCAGLGTKATHLAQLTADTGEILAVDLHPRKLNILEKSCKRMGVTSVRIKAGDARRLGELVGDPPDYVLVDAPCSGLGVLRRRADARWRKNAQQLAQLPQLQYELVAAAADCLAPGGVLVYSTCTIEPEENQSVVARLISNFPEMEPENVNQFLPRPLPQVGDANGSLQLYPHVHGTDGFFIARLRKRRVFG